MKKNNNKYRNNYSNSYSLNYKFDSCSIAGKISGTALDLIKKYNELAKEAQSNGDHVNAEVFRQYAEHYRKIVTDINEKRAQNSYSRNQNNSRAEFNDISLSDNVSAANEEVDADIVLEEVTKAPVIDITAELGSESADIISLEPAKKSFTVIEIKPEISKSELIENNEEAKPKAKRTYRRKIDKTTDKADNALAV